MKASQGVLSEWDEALTQREAHVSPRAKAKVSTDITDHPMTPNLGNWGIVTHIALERAYLGVVFVTRRRK